MTLILFCASLSLGLGSKANYGGRPIQITVPDKELSRPYWPKELREGGYVGNLKIHEGVCVLIIPRPDARDQDIAKGLELLAEEFKYKAKIKERAQEP